MSKTDHPRSRGEHPLPLDKVSRESGSSPLTRGARELVGVGRLRGRIIPAHAGSTDEQKDSDAEIWDHPRSRGEHLLALAQEGRNPGSSPLTRGALIGSLIALA